MNSKFNTLLEFSKQQDIEPLLKRYRKLWSDEKNTSCCISHTLSIWSLYNYLWMDGLKIVIGNFYVHYYTNNILICEFSVTEKGYSIKHMFFEDVKESSEFYYYKEMDWLSSRCNEEFCQLQNLLCDNYGIRIYRE